MYLESYALIKTDGYGGYQCIVVDDEGKKHSVLASPREHASKRDIHNAAYAALKDEAVAEKESMLEKAEEIMKQVAKEKGTPEETLETPVVGEEEEVAPVIEGLEEIDVSGMKFFELKAYAKDRGIKVTNKSKKKDILAALKNV